MDGSGTGTFASALTGLEPSTTYYVRAYATNSAGTAYGDETSFKTTYAGILYVSSTGQCGGKSPCYTTIQAAVDAATTGCAIYVSTGTYDAFTLDEDKAPGCGRRMGEFIHFSNRGRNQYQRGTEGACWGLDASGGCYYDALIRERGERSG